ncbi:hypothetical protein ACFQZ4_43760 [Catellatospora coxensis]
MSETPLWLQGRTAVIDAADPSAWRDGKTPTTTCPTKSCRASAAPSTHPTPSKRSWRASSRSSRWRSPTRRTPRPGCPW